MFSMIQKEGYGNRIIGSMYEVPQPLSIIAETHMVEWFSGSVINSDRWTERDVQGTNTFAMADEVDGGFKITTGTTTGNRGLLHFNDIRHYDSSGCIIIGIFRTPSQTFYRAGMGMSDRNTMDQDSNIIGAFAVAGDQFTEYVVISDSGSSQGFTASSVTVDFISHVHKVEIFGGVKVNYLIDGILEATKTGAQIPGTGVKMQPGFTSQTTNTTAKTSHITYMEAYNN